MKKKIIIILVMALMICGCGKVSKLENGTDAVVSMKDSKISVDSLYEKMKDRYAISVLIDMIDEEILNVEYKDELKDAEKYATDTIEGLQENYESKDEFLDAVNAYYGFSDLNEFENYIKLNHLRDLATTDYAKKQITDKQIEAYYESDIVGDIEASHILISVDVDDDATDEEKEKAEEKAKKEAEDIIKKLDDGEDFAELAKKYSDDEGSKSDGGALGKFNKGDMVEPFEEAAYALKVNEYTKEPVKSTHGYHIILKTKEYEKAKLDDVKDEIISDLADELLQEDPTISITALTELRKEKSMKIEDDNLKSQYNKYINSLYNYYNTTQSAS